MLIFALLFVHINNIYALNKLTKKASIQVLSSYIFIKNIEIGFQIMPSYSDYHILQICYSTDWLFNNYNLDNKFNSGFSAGTGLSLDYYRIEFNLLINYIYQTGFDNQYYPDGFKYNSVYISLNPKFKVDKFFICISGRYYFNKIKIDNHFNNYLMNIGFGVNLQ